MINQLSHLFTTSVPNPHKLGIVYNTQDTHSLFPLSSSPTLVSLIFRFHSPFTSRKDPIPLSLFYLWYNFTRYPSNFRFLLTTNLFLRAGLSILYPRLPSFSMITSKEMLPFPFLSLFVVSSPITLGGLIENSLNSVFIFSRQFGSSFLMEFTFATHRRRSLCARQ